MRGSARSIITLIKSHYCSRAICNIDKLANLPGSQHAEHARDTNIRRSSRAQHVNLSTRSSQHKETHYKTPVKSPHGRHTHALINRGSRLVPWASPVPDLPRSSLRRKRPPRRGKLPRKCPWTLRSIYRRQMNLHRTTWRRSRYPRSNMLVGAGRM